MKDYKITKEDFIENRGYSSHYFFNHSIYFLEHSPSDINIEYYRCKLVLSYKEKKIIIRCHYKNRSKHFATILNSNNKEIITFRDTIEPMIITMIIHLLLDFQH